MTLRSSLAKQAIGLLICSAKCKNALSQETTQSLKPLKLHEAVAGALGNNVGINNSQLEVGICKEEVAAIRTHFLPTIKFTALGLQLLTPLNFSFDKGVFGDFEGTGRASGALTFATLSLVPVINAIAVLALKIVSWES